MSSKSHLLVLAACAVAACLSLVSTASADTFGTGGNQFTIDFITISSDTNPTGGRGYVSNDYRIGVYEITNDQWNKFQAQLGVPVTGSPSEAYDQGPSFAGTSVPVNGVSWYEAAQFMNWLNTSTGHHPAYRFTGTQGTGDYAFDTWSATEAAGGTNLFRHKDAFYFLPTATEWTKAGYWNGSSLQYYATKAGETLHQGDGSNGTGWNYVVDSSWATDPYGPWEVGSGSEELNGTYDMMGNASEWMEYEYRESSYDADASRQKGGGNFTYYDHQLSSSNQSTSPAHNESLRFSAIGFRVASEVPEPASLGLLSFGGLALLRRRLS